MKEYIYFFVLFTFLEVIFSTLYFLLVKTVDMRMLIGAGIYTLGMLSGYACYKEERYRQQRQALLDALL